MTDLSVVDTRAGLDESRHHVAVAICDAEGRMVASAGHSTDPIFWRSAAKPFQLWPLVDAGGVERFELDAEMLALACGSHNADPMHLAVAERWLARIGISVDDLACGGHLSLSRSRAAWMQQERITPDSLWSNCSGKHSAMLAMARMHDWPLEGYQAGDHPVQQRIADSIARWTALKPEELAWGVDGCTARAVATPLDRMARAWAQLGCSDDPAMATIRSSILAHPEMVAGTDRLDTRLMQGWPGRILAKMGAAGVFGAALPTLGLGLALKVSDGDNRSAAIALIGILERLVAVVAPDQEWPLEALSRWHDPVIVNTQAAVTGQSELRGSLEFT